VIAWDGVVTVTEPTIAVQAPVKSADVRLINLEVPPAGIAPPRKKRKTPRTNMTERFGIASKNCPRMRKVHRLARNAKITSAPARLPINASVSGVTSPNNCEIAIVIAAAKIMG
jgi:hypothetical protein